MLSERFKWAQVPAHCVDRRAVLDINPFHYVQTLGFFDSVRSELGRTAAGAVVVLVASSNFKPPTGFANRSTPSSASAMPLRATGRRRFRIGRSPDADFKYFTTRVAAFKSEADGTRSWRRKRNATHVEWRCYQRVNQRTALAAAAHT